MPRSALEVAFGEQLKLDEGAYVADVLEEAADANRATEGRTGSVVDLPAEGRLVMTGDLHDHATNLQRIVNYAGLDENPNHYLILHEVVHGEQFVQGHDLSIRTLARVAALKAAYPSQVLLILSNHELAQYNGSRILKGSDDVVATFDAGLEFLFDEEADEVRDAFRAYVRTLPLAVRAPNGIMCCHSLPGAKYLDQFDTEIISRELDEDDLLTRGSAYRMVWGRNHDQSIADRLAEAWHVQQFVLGHQPAEVGYETQGETMLILASDHEQGMLLPIDLSADAYTRRQLIDALVPINSLDRQ